MFIQTEETPNPAALKFIPGVDVMVTGNAEFNSEEEAKNSPLAKCLFNIDGVQSVFLGSDFIAVTKIDSLEYRTSYLYLKNSAREIKGSTPKVSNDLNALFV